MSEKWKNISSTDKSVIKANTIFTNRLICNNGEFRNDICFNNVEISLDDGIVIDNVITVHTHRSIKTSLLKCNVIDLSRSDLSYIDISSSIYTNASGGFYYIRGEDFSSSNLRVADLCVNMIGVFNDTNTGLYFNSDSVSFDNTIKAGDISVNYISSLYDSSIILHSDTIIDGSLNVGKLVTREIFKQSSTDYIEIHGDISTNKHIDALDISVSNSVKVGGDLTLSIIDSREPNNYVSFNTDISINGIVDASGVTIRDIYALNGNIIGLTNDLSINGGASIQDISFDGNISPLDGCLNVVGDISFTKHIQAKQMTVESITHHSFHDNNDHNDGSGIVFQTDVSIVGIILANNKPKNYRAVVRNNFNDLVMELASNYGDGALGLLIPELLLNDDGVYADGSLNEFNPDIAGKDISYVNIDDNNPLNKTSLYVQTTQGTVKKIATINDDISYHAIRMSRGADVSNWLEVYDDVSHTFGYNTSEIIGLRNGVFNDDSHNRVHFLDISAFDPEGFDVSYMFYSESVNTQLIGFDVSFVGDGTDYRIRVITPSSETYIQDLSFNMVAHDYTNYIIRQVSMVHDKHLTAKEPSWNEINLRTYGFSERTFINTDLSWNDLSLSNKISEADTRDVSTAHFDISLNQCFGDNSDNIYYIIDLAAINNTSDPSFQNILDLSFNIKINDGDLSRNIELSGNKLYVETSIPNGKSIADYQKDTSINILVHNYYDFTNSTDPSFDFYAAGVTPGDVGYTTTNSVTYKKDISRNIVLNVCDIIINKAPIFNDFKVYGISYGEGWKTDFYNDNSFDSSFYNFDDINTTNSSLNDPSFTYYIWDTSSIYDKSLLQYRFDFSGLDPEGFGIDISKNKNNTDTSMNFDLTRTTDNNYSLIVTTTGNRDISENNSSLSIYFDDCGNFISDYCYNKIHLTFHPFLYKFKEFTFTNCDGSGYVGPLLEDCSNHYTDRYEESLDIYSLDYWWTDSSYLNMKDNTGIQLWTVPATGQYDINIAGAGGGRSYGNEDQREGYGAVFDTSVILQRGDIYRILIGQRGQLGNSNSGKLTGYQEKVPMASSGGGGTFFIKNSQLLDIYEYLTNSNSSQDEVETVINDISHLFIAVAGGGSGGRTWNDHYDSDKRTITDASHTEYANSGSYQDDELTRDEFIKVNQYAPGREIGQLTDGVGNVYGGPFPYTGGGGGGGLFRVGGYAGIDICNASHQAQPFISGGKGGLNKNTLIDIIGNASKGGFGGGGAGGDGGSGGGGGYAGGGADTHTKIVGDNLTGKNIDPEKKSYAGGGSSFVNQTLNMTKSDLSLNYSSDSHGYLHIKFNPYNTL